MFILMARPAIAARFLTTGVGSCYNYALLTSVVFKSYN